MQSKDLDTMATQQRLIAQALDRAGLAQLGTVAHDLADKIRQQALNKEDGKCQSHMIAK